MSLPWPAPAPPTADWPLVPVRPPVSMILMAIAWKVAGICRPFMLAVRLDRSWAFTSAPRIATPVTAPISRLVFVADAAMPERSGGTALSAEEVTGTTVVPTPTPTRTRARASGAYEGFGLSVTVVSSSPALNSRQPIKIDGPGPAAVVQRPASSEARITRTVLGGEAGAVFQPRSLAAP